MGGSQGCSLTTLKVRTQCSLQQALEVVLAQADDLRGDNIQALKHAVAVAEETGVDPHLLRAAKTALKQAVALCALASSSSKEELASAVHLAQVARLGMEEIKRLSAVARSRVDEAE